MSLVAYDDSDSNSEEEETVNDSEENDFSENHQVIIKRDSQTKKAIEIPNNRISEQQESGSDSDLPTSVIKTENSNKLFALLPPPKSQNNSDLKPDDLNFCNDYDKLKGSDSAARKPVKISVPSLSQFENEDDLAGPKKKLKQTPKGSGLFSILPEPKSQPVKESKRLLIPYSINKNPKPVSQIVAPNPPVSNPAITTNDSDEEEIGSKEEEEVKNNFFSFDSDDYKVPVAESSELSSYCEPAVKDEPLSFKSDFQPSPWSQVNKSAEFPEREEQVETEYRSQEFRKESATSGSDDFISVQTDDLELDEEAMLRLCGRRRKGQPHNMELIDVSGDKIMPNPSEWLVKQISEEAPVKSHSHRKHDGPTTQQRRKHQITYLAFQAKEKELELKNQWSQNRMSRKQTQSKYGF